MGAIVCAIGVSWHRWWTACVLGSIVCAIGVSWHRWWGACVLGHIACAHLVLAPSSVQSGFPGTDGGAQIVVQFRWHQSCISMLCCFMCIVAIVVSMNRYPDSPTIFLVVRPMFVSNSVSNTKTWKERPKVGEDESQRGREGESVRESDGRGRGMVEESDRDRASIVLRLLVGLVGTRNPRLYQCFVDNPTTTTTTSWYQETPIVPMLCRQSYYYYYYYYYCHNNNYYYYYYYYYIWFWLPRLCNRGFLAQMVEHRLLYSSGGISRASQCCAVLCALWPLWSV